VDRAQAGQEGGETVIFFALSFVIGNTLLSYIIGTEQLFQIITDDPRNHLTGLMFMILFTLIFYLLFAPLPRTGLPPTSVPTAGSRPR